MALLPALVASACALFKFSREHNPDLHVESIEKFGIDESRALIEQASLRSTSGRTLFILAIQSITSEAQQALLKLFEEPTPGTIFVLLVPHGSLQGTLRSRFIDYPERLTALAGQGSDAIDFMSWPYKKRSDWIAAFLKDEEQVRERTRTFLDELEAALYAKLEALTGALRQELLMSLGDVAHFRTYLGDRAPSLKMILEHFAATVPTIAANN